jgi:prophage maintenance system killer protein
MVDPQHAHVGAAAASALLDVLGRAVEDAHKRHGAGGFAAGRRDPIALRPQPTVWDLAAFYLDRLIRDQVFHDGNKRTALEATRLFLEGAGYRLSLVPPTETVEFIANVAKGGVTRDAIAEWLRDHSKRKSNGRN